MTKQTASITFYEIDRCGYYNRGSDVPEFGSLSHLLDDLQSWASGEDMTLDKTCTYEVGEESHAYGTFCFDVAKDVQSNSYLLTTWNEIPSNSAQVAAVDGAGKLGVADVSVTPLPEGRIPGYPTYFWILPDKDLFATVQFGKTLNGRESLEYYMRGFLRKYSHYVELIQRRNGTSVLGYRKDSTFPPDAGLIPQFHSRLCRKAGQVDYLLKHSSQVYKIIRKETIDFSSAPSYDLWQRNLKMFGISQPSSPDKESEKFRLEHNHQPSSAEMHEMIEFWREKSELDERWDDIGFKLTSEDKVRWLSHTLVRSKFPLDIPDDTKEVIDANSLLKQLVLSQETILAILSESDA
jgi:hypothetical protein